MEQALSLGSCFFKGHGHGNDYLVFEEGHSWLVTPGTVQKICHRNRGVGADGIVALLSSRPPMASSTEQVGADKDMLFRLRMFNPDGREFERSGNGLRILAAYLHSTGRVAGGGGFAVEVGGESVEMEILGEEPGGVLDVAVEMGTARFGIGAVGGEPGAFGVRGSAAPGPISGVDVSLEGPDGSVLAVCPVSIGNPHCVVFKSDLQEGDLLELGPFLTNNPAFPEGVNVQIAEVRSPREVEILIWERGVGRTASSGTSACAVAAAGVRTGLLDPGSIRVGMEGGAFLIRVYGEMLVRLEGPVQALCTGELSEELVAGLKSPRS